MRLKFVFAVSVVCFWSACGQGTDVNDEVDQVDQSKAAVGLNCTAVNFIPPEGVGFTFSTRAQLASANIVNQQCAYSDNVSTQKIYGKIKANACTKLSQHWDFYDGTSYSVACQVNSLRYCTPDASTGIGPSYMASCISTDEIDAADPNVAGLVKNFVIVEFKNGVWSQGLNFKKVLQSGSATNFFARDRFNGLLYLTRDSASGPLHSKPKLTGDNPTQLWTLK